MTYDDYVDSVKSYFVKTATKKALAYIVGKAAFLAWGPLGYLTKLVVEKVMLAIVDEGELLIFFKFIDFRTSKQGREFHDALVKNQETQKNGTSEEKQNAENNLKDTFRELVKLTN